MIYGSVILFDVQITDAGKMVRMAARPIQASFFGIKQLAKLYGTSILKVREALMAQRVMAADGTPRRPEYARMKIPERGMPWFNWDNELASQAITAHGLTKPKTKIPTSPLTSRTQAEERLCAAIARGRELAGFDRPSQNWA